MAAIVALLLFYGSSLYYLHLGLPGVGPISGMSIPVAWEDMASKIEAINDRLGDDAIIVGMDRYKISSAFAFYDPDNDGLQHTSGSHLFGHESVMWKFWQPAIATQGRKVVLVSFKPNELNDPELSNQFARTSPITQQSIEKNGHVVGHFYYRVGYGYHYSSPTLTTDLRSEQAISSSF